MGNLNNSRIKLASRVLGTFIGFILAFGAVINGSLFLGWLNFALAVIAAYGVLYSLIFRRIQPRTIRNICVTLFEVVFWVFLKKFREKTQPKPTACHDANRVEK